MACAIGNGNKDSPPEFGDNVLKIVVMGEPKCGKTTFIRKFLRNHGPVEETSINGVRVYPYEMEYNGDLRTFAVYEIPGHPDFLLEQRSPHYERADVFVFMYAIDDQSSIERVANKWFDETVAMINQGVPVVIVGNKNDLRNNQQVIERLASKNEAPVTFEDMAELFGPCLQDFTRMEISSYDSDEVLQAFETIIDRILVFETP